MAVPRLRVKTGCQTCRTRKKKCDEARPICQRCTALGWRCTWPTSEDLVDRRQKSAPRRKSHYTIKDEPNPEEQQQWDWEEGQLCLTSSPTSFEELAHDIQPMLFDYFNDKYFQLILLPSCHPEYSLVTFNEIETQLPDCRGLQYTVLANAASHVYSIGKSGSMKELALIYYSQALRDLHQLLETASDLETDNGLLISVILLYTLGSTSMGTYSDVPRHLGAAVKILTLRMFQTRAAVRPRVLPAFERLLFESVLNAMFTVSLGLWSEPFDSDDAFQPSFWLHAERLLNHSDISPPPPTGLRNPVVGVPIALLKLFLLIRQLLSDLNGTDIDTIRDLKLEVASWESSIDYCSVVDHAHNDDGELGAPHLQMAQDAASLFIVCISVLTEQLLSGDSNINIPLPHDPESWQMQLARSVMEKYGESAIWARFFNINMAVYTLGFFVARDHDIDLIRRDLQRRWDHTNFGLTLRYRKDLETTWASRGLGGS